MVVAPEAAARLQRELGAGERLLWAGKPRAGLLLRPADALVIPFSLLWAGFACYWEYSVITSGAPLILVLWGIPFVLAGAYMVVGRFFTDARRRERTVYGLTSERVIIAGSGARSITSLSLRTLTDVTLVEDGDGSGSIAFGPGAQSAWMRSLGPRPRRGPAPPTFELIPRAKEVYEAIRAAQRGAA